MAGTNAGSDSGAGAGASAAPPAESRPRRRENHRRSVEKRREYIAVFYLIDTTIWTGGWQRLDEPLRTITTVDRFALVTPASEGYRMRMLPVALALAMVSATSRRGECIRLVLRWIQQANTFAPTVEPSLAVIGGGSGASDRLG